MNQERRRLRGEDRLRLDVSAQLIAGPGGEILVVNGEQAWELRGVERSVLGRLARAVDGQRSVEEICAELADVCEPDHLREILEVLRKPVLHEDPDAIRPSTRAEEALGRVAEAKVAVLGNATLGATIAERLRTQGMGGCTLYAIRSFASCLTPEFCEAARSRIVWPETRDRVAEDRLAGPAWVEERQAVTLAELRHIFMAHEVVVCALEGVPYRALLDANEIGLTTGRPCLMVTVEGTQVAIGPTVLAAGTACFACRPLATTFASYRDRRIGGELLSLLSARRLQDPDIAQDAARMVLGEVQRLVGRPAKAELAGATVRLSPSGRAQRLLTVPLTDCPWCGRGARREAPADDAAARALGRRSTVALGLELDLRAALPVRGQPAAAPDAYRTVGIVGGGTAGYLTALALRARRPELQVTLIESSRIPVIGVGEATVPRLLDFLHGQHNLGLDIVDFYHRVLPTWKLGIKFYWGLPGDYAFHGSFQFGSLLEPMVYRGNIDAYCLGALLQARDRVPVFGNGDGSYTSLLHKVPFAYHLDNPRFVRYLKDEAERFGVRLLDRMIVDAALSADGEEIDHLIDEDREQHRFDLYIDATGFRSFLIERKLGSRYISYASSLFTDSAVMANVPHDGIVKPYTTAESMDHGWCWNIPFEDEDHRGYVFSSAFCSVDEAVAEMRRKNPAMSEPWSLKFRSGRHEHFWKGNVVAVGNSYAFVEPLESTAIQMLNLELDLLTSHFPASRSDAAVKHALTTKINGMWDNLCGFLAIHYKFNRKFDTPFWRECRARADLFTAQERVEVFRERAPLMYSSSLFRGVDPFKSDSASDFFSQEYAYDVVLAGQQVPAKYIVPAESRSAFETRMKLLDEMVDWALPQAEALRLLREDPDSLFSIKESSESWINLRRY
jgi:tryptophan 7-halogenase